jgi:MFS family permease
LNPKPLTKSIASLFPFYYGWVIVAVSLVSLMVAYGIWWSFPIFYVSMLKEFGWSRAGTAAIFAIGSIVYGFCSLPAGVLIDRVGPRKLLPAAAVLVAVGCLISSAATEKWHFYLSYGAFMGIGTICMGYVPISALISNWFVQRRGRALGIALMGNVAPPLLAYPIQELISLAGWRAAYMVLAAVLLLVVVPLAGFFMRTRPQELGLEPDGGGLRQTGDNLSKGRCRNQAFQEVINPKWAEKDWDLPSSLKTFQFWALTGVMFTLGIGNGTLMSHLVAMVVDLGRSPEIAAFIFSLAGLVAAAGRLSGFLSDRMGREATFALVTILYLASVLALLFFLQSPQIWPLYLYAVTFGLGYGLGSPTLSSGAADLFIGRSFGSILGFSNIAFGVGQGIGAWAGGVIFDATGSYSRAVWMTLPCYILMCVSFWLMAPRKVRRMRNCSFGSIQMK